MERAREPAWLRAEREYEDDIFERGTIPELFEASARRHLGANAQLYKGGVYDRSLAGTVPRAGVDEYAALTYGELREVVRRLAAGFRDLGLGAGDRVAIFADTRMEWAQTDLALLAAGCVVTTVYTESSPERVRYLLDDPDATAVVVENETLLERVLAVEDDLDLSEIVLVDRPSTSGDREDVHSLSEVYERGRETFDHDTYREWVEARDPEDLASIIYTSGTTGEPKGVRLTHWNFRSNVHGSLRRLGARPDRSPDVPALDSGSVSISFLPLAHVFERLTGHFVILAAGATVGYAESPDTIPEDIRKIRPTTGASVPRVYERIFDSMRDRAGESGLSRRIFEWAVDVATEYQRTDNPGTALRAKHAVADRLVYSSVREQLGGRVDFLVSGGSRLDEDLCRLFDGMGITVLEGYGLTETSPVVSVNPPEDVQPGTIGVPLVGVDVRIDGSRVDAADFPDADGEVGELLVKGDNVTPGYWNRPEATEAAFTEDGWFRTGDVVERRPDGFLVFEDRHKQLLVLSTGKNVAPGPIEDRFATSDRVDQVMVLGDGRKFVAALVVPDFESLRAWARRNDVPLPEDREALVRDERVREWVREDIARVNADLGDVESIKEFRLVDREWTRENDMLTPSLKKKRPVIASAHADLIADIYGEDG